MLKILYFLLLFVVSLEDYRHHTVKPRWIATIGIIGFLNCITKENRWVTLALTCACFLLLFLVYQLIRILEKRYSLSWKFGGADVRLIPGMMLMQGWDVALTGIFVGLFLAVGYYVFKKGKSREIPLVPWMSAGCLMVELLFYITKI